MATKLKQNSLKISDYNVPNAVKLSKEKRNPLQLPQTSTKINVWKYVIISLIPFIGYYPFVKLKKTRRIFLVNIPIGLANVIVLIFINHILGNAMAWVMLPCIDACFVYHWAIEHNNKLQT